MLITDFGFAPMKGRGSSAGPTSRRPQGERGHQEPHTFWGRVNQAALQKLDRWVLKLFPEAIFYESTGAYRIKPAMLKRTCEEDLSIAPHGIVDWGVWDEGDNRQ